MAEFINTADIIGDDEMCDQILMRTVTEYKENRISKVGQYAFYGCTALTVVDVPNVTVIDQNAFDGCSSLEAANMPNVTEINTYAFRDTPINFLELPHLTRLITYPFMNSKIKCIVAPMLTEIPDSAFRWVVSLVQADFTSLVKINGNYNFQNAPLAAFILRNTSSVCSLSNATHFTDSAIAKGAGYIYVPSALVDSYKAATNWSTYAEQIRAIEDYTVDGTVTGQFVRCSGITLDQTALTFDVWSKQMLTATILTPSPLGLDEVVWKSGDESIARVANGVVIPTGKGTTTITASCNGYSATCEVVVNMEGLPMLYTLAEPKTFNGSSDYIDTGVQLFDTAKDFTIICEADFSKLTTGNTCLFHCMNEASPYPGLSGDGQNGVRICYTGSSSLQTSISNRNDVSTLAIRYVDGKMNAIRYRNASGNIVTHAVSGTPTYTKVTQNLLLGAYQTTAGVKGRFFSGTISRFDVYPNALSDEQIEAFL